MQRTLTIPDDLDRQLVDEARVVGEPVENLLVDLAKWAMAMRAPARPHKQVSVEELAEIFKRMESDPAFRGKSLPLDFSRDDIYYDHD